MASPLVFNIQKFSVHDGPGIRTTIFFKGRPICCWWCHNPESQCYEQEIMENREGRRETVGQPYTVAQLVKEAEKDIIFYDQSGGGVTLSGGEPMTQDRDFMERLVKELHRKGISVAVDTCGVVPYENYARILPYVDLFLYDLKFLDSSTHATFTGEPNEQVLSNLIRLSQDSARINLRLVMLDGLNTSLDDMRAIVDWLKAKSVRVDSINLLPYHDYGRDKYRRLQREYQTDILKRPSDDALALLKTFLEQHNYRVAIGGAEVNKIS